MTAAGRRRRWVIGLAAAAVVALAVLTVATVANLLSDPGIGSVPSGSGGVSSASATVPAPTADPTVSEPATDAAPTPTPGVPVPSISGQMPGPDATVPARSPGVVGARVEAIAAAAGGQGLVCESFEQDPEMGASYRLSCTAEVDGASLNVTSDYWGLDYVDEVRGIVLASGDGSIEPGRAVELFVALATAVVGNEPGAVEFVETHVDDPACVDAGCEFVTPTATITLVYGLNGARQLSIGL